MLSRESTLKELINEISLNWFKTIVNEKMKKIRIEIDELAQQMPMLLQVGNTGLEIETSINQIQSEVGVLRNLDDIRMYAQKNSFNAGETLFKNNSISFESITKFLQHGESFAKMIIRFQMGETFAITVQILDKLEILNTKIGNEELLKNIQSKDLDYLLTKTLEQWTKEILDFLAKNPTDADNVLIEIQEVINDPSWTKKAQNADIIERYFAKFKATSLFGNLTSPEDLKDQEKQEQIISYSQIVGSIHSLIYLIKLNQSILEEFQKITA